MSSTGWADPLDEQVVKHARVIPLDVVQAKGNGHAGTASSLTPALYVLFQEYLQHDPADPQWEGRDRFILSCGHTSLSLYLQLYLSGYGLEIEDLAAARSFGSRTPGHPERGHTAGVETSTGPLGQGIGNAVGLAMASRRIRGLLDPESAAGASPFDHRVWCFASDGDLQEGISHEAGALGGHLGLANLILVWDDNEISIEGDTGIATSDDPASRFAGYGWHVVVVEDAEDPIALRVAYDQAVAHEGPVFIRLRTTIGFPMPTVAGTAGAHSGAPGSEELAATKTSLGLDPAVSLAMPAELLEHARDVRRRGHEANAVWQQGFTAWQETNPERAELLARLRSATPPAGWDDHLPEFIPGSSVATRIASSKVLAALTGAMPELWGGSADLAETNGTLIDGMPSFLPPGLDSTQWPGDPAGQMIHFGIREHAMGAILSGMALGGLTRPYGATFFVFSDYMRPAVRLAALMQLPVTYLWTHDSVAVGEDGPTHQPVEHLWSYRAIPGLQVIRPADARETVGAWRRVIESPSGPAAFVLSRQGLPVLDLSQDEVTAGVVRGAWVVADTAGTPDVLIIATGSEVSLALDARAVLADSHGVHARVVSAPCLEWFEEQSADYRESVLPAAVTARVSVEAGIAQGWWKYVGLHGSTVSVESFGHSGRGDLVLADAGVTLEAIVVAAQATLSRSSGSGGTKVG